MLIDGTFFLLESNERQRTINSVRACVVVVDTIRNISIRFGLDVKFLNESYKTTHDFV